MNQKDRDYILQSFGVFSGKIGDTTITFARQTREDADGIEKMETDKLVEEFKSLVWINYVYGQVSVNEIQRISLIEAELSSRKYDFIELTNWYENEKLEESKHENQ